MTSLVSIVERMHAAFNARAFDEFGDVFHEDALVVVDGTAFHGLAAVIGYATAVTGQFPGLKTSVDRVIAETSDMLVAEVSQTHLGPGGAKDAQDVWPLRGTSCEVHRIADGRIVECRTYLSAYASDAGLSGVPARTALARTSAEQSALRRVATLVARGSSQAVVLDAIILETYRLVGEEFTSLHRYDPDGAAVAVALHGAREEYAVGDVQPAEGDGVTQRVLRTALPARVDDYSAQPGHTGVAARALNIVSVAGAPIIVQGKVWGMLGAASRERHLPADIEGRLAQFAELAALAIASAQARAELQSLADEQAALRRVAELVARGVPANELFDAVALEASLLHDDVSTTLLRFEPDGAVVVVAVCGGLTPLGMRVPANTGSLASLLWRTGRVARIDRYAGLEGSELARELGVVSGVSAPITVDSRLWGMLAANGVDGPLPAGTEHRLAQFAELVAAAIGNAESHAELMASRARIVSSADDARRRLRRDVHDGAQQSLVHTLITLKMAQTELGANGDAATLVDEALGHAQRASAEMREIARGILPAALSRGGLTAGVDSIVANFQLPVEVDIVSERLPTGVETTAYFIVAEALTNVTKHAGAQRASVRISLHDDRLLLEVSDDGRGGADSSRGSGLVGLADRVHAIGGTIAIVSPPGAGTTLSITLPIASEALPLPR